MISLAVLTDTHPAWRPDRLREAVADSGVDFRFRTAKLLDLQPRLDELLAGGKLFALDAIEIRPLVRRGARTAGAGRRGRTGCLDCDTPL
jgi:hypothetical protein